MLPPTLEHRLAELAAQYGIRLALLFGSASSGQVHDGSDLDLALLLDDPGLDLGTFAELQHGLQGAVPDRQLDLAIINHADPLFLHQIVTKGELAYGSPRVLQNLKLYAFRRHHDHKRFLEMERAYVRRIVEKFDAA